MGSQATKGGKVLKISAEYCWQKVTRSLLPVFPTQRNQSDMGSKQRDGTVNSINIRVRRMTMRHATMFRTLAMAALFTLGASFLGTAEAGQFKRMTGSNLLPNGGFIQAYASPLNTGAAMEMDVYEFQTIPVLVDGWRCFVNVNTTGRALNVRMINVIGTVATSCTTPVGGTCFTPFINLSPNLLFQCTVSTGNGSPVAAGSFYRFGIQR
jgi:hypothetical protein